MVVDAAVPNMFPVSLCDADPVAFAKQSVNVYEEEECTYNLSLEYYLLHNYNMIGMANSTAAA